ncbi:MULTISPECIES: ABC transporter substrate-binding protein [Brenneria]|uniref:ABC transporter substrate-binding protein n=1 Tax=Brenneria nigrifluens DSM 30175 = ATCC 13028 TaxID=1121120 RepID=A0A2U1US75_9GAMM|nr:MULTISPECIES: ABC transporter substrate-binding protein [Brenneria]EHD21108.1 nitrate/sulfonate/bicarbonate ABC transporter periplasmic protein [Brenneria sp. EniD312]PWC24528.1 ABC transporter substrate-binding protein [Brenneria nigrifluens DSM 30175 = ATCC 13028]QCR04259.1 ABC transporter substrate-binding protein [Brenneria nigrifluens DSM 30175 = ATCC 13028]
MKKINRAASPTGRFSRKLIGLTSAVSLLASALALPTQAYAEGQLRIAQQFGIVYLLLNVAQDKQLIEKHAKADGLEVKVDYLQLSGGAAVNDALLSGSVDIAGAGIGPLFTLWDRTKNRQNVRAVLATGQFPYYLISTNPNVKSIADFTDKDRIAVPAVGVSVQSRYLQQASAKLWGDKEFNRLDKLQVALPHPDATAAIISAGTEITAHFGNAPFQEQELAGNPNAHIVLNSYDVQGGPTSPVVLYTTEKFRKENPRTYRVFVNALAEAAEFADQNPEEAADAFIRITKSKIDRKLLLDILKSPESKFSITPQNTLQLGQFLHRVGAIKNKPESVKDYFFDDPHVASGS